jgi:ribosome modulation factor
MSHDDELLVKATMQGYVSALLQRSKNPYPYITPEAWAWQHGYEQGHVHAIRTMVKDPNNPPMPYPEFDREVTIASPSRAIAPVPAGNDAIGHGAMG